MQDTSQARSVGFSAHLSLRHIENQSCSCRVQEVLLDGHMTSEERGLQPHIPAVFSTRIASDTPVCCFAIGNRTTQDPRQPKNREAQCRTKIMIMHSYRHSFS